MPNSATNTALMMPRIAPAFKNPDFVFGHIPSYLDYDSTKQKMLSTNCMKQKQTYMI